MTPPIPVVVPRPPPPPVPPPPPPATQNVNSKSLEAGHTETKQITEQDFVNEIHELLENSKDRIGGDVVENPVTLVVAMPLQTVILQNGPMCGIVALAEALEIVNERKKPSSQPATAAICPKAILDEAIRKGYTKQGEMFSVQAVQSLAELFGASPEHSKIVHVSKNTEDGSEILKQELFKEIVLHIINDGPVLFPYDADHNHTPALRKGHAAHWAVIHGLACSCPYSHLPSILKQDDETVTNKTPSSMLPFQILQSSRDLIILKPSPDTSDTTTTTNNNNENNSLKLSLTNIFTCENTHVIAHQGKSFRTALWKYTDLLKSNENLKEIAPKIMAEKEHFVLHEGIEEGLCSKILLLK